MIRLLAQIFAMAISNGVTGMTSRCSTVPCSRSRTTAAPGENDRQHGHGGNDAHDAGEPGGDQIGIEGDPHDSGRWRQGADVLSREEFGHFVGEYLLDVAGADPRLHHGGGVDIDLHGRAPPAEEIALEIGGNVENESIGADIHETVDFASDPT